MLNSTYYAEFHTLFIARNANEKCAFLIITPSATQSVAHLIAKCCDAAELCSVGFHGEFFLRIGRSGCCPTLSIDDYIRVNSLRCLTYCVHGLYVVDAHKVETEAVNVKFLHPVEHAFHHVFAHHRHFRGGLVATTRTIACHSLGRLSAFSFAIVLPTEEIVGHGLLEIALHKVENVIIYHVHHYAQTSLVHCHYHLLKLLYACCRIGRICGIATFRAVVVDWVITPIIVSHLVSTASTDALAGALIDASVIVRRKKMYVGDTKFLEMVSSCGESGRISCAFLCEGKEFTLVFDAGRSIYGEVAMVHLIEHYVRHSIHLRRLVSAPTSRVSGSEVHYHGSLAVSSHGFGKDTRRFFEPFSIYLHLESVEETVAIAVESYAPCAVFSTL